ncbi:unnamed protein product, partial [Linum tenue]
VSSVGIWAATSLIISIPCSQAQRDTFSIYTRQRQGARSTGVIRSGRAARTLNQVIVKNSTWSSGCRCDRSKYCMSCSSSLQIWKLWGESNKLFMLLIRHQNH